MNTAHSKISHTARFVAHLRTLTDIKYADLLAKACNAEEHFNAVVGEHPEQYLWFAALIEMRYKSIDAAYNSGRTQNVVELAAGLSPRGLILTEDSTINFLETDLEKMWCLKRLIYGLLLERGRPNFSGRTANAVRHDDFMEIDRALPDFGAVTFICEGLLPYLTHAEKRTVSTNILNVLKKRRGCWITPDISSHARIQALLKIDPSIGEVMKSISGSTGRDLVANSLSTVEEAEAFFRGCGFRIIKVRQSEFVPELSCAGKIAIDEAKLSAINQHSYVWIMEPK